MTELDPEWREKSQVLLGRIMRIHKGETAMDLLSRERAELMHLLRQVPDLLDALDSRDRLLTAMLEIYEEPNTLECGPEVLDEIVEDLGINAWHTAKRAIDYEERKRSAKKSQASSTKDGESGCLGNNGA